MILSKNKILIFVFFTLAFALGAQTKTQKELEVQRQQIMSEIRLFNNLLSDQKQEQKNVLDKVEDLNFKIRSHQTLIRLTNKQVNLTSRKIRKNQEDILKLKDRIDRLRQQYGLMVVKSYKGRGKKNKLLFLLSSSSFQQAYKRLQYLKQYAAYQKKQAVILKQETKKLKSLNETLYLQRQQKQQLIAENTVNKLELEKDLALQQGLIVGIRNNLSKYQRQLKLKQKQAKKIDRQIQKIIRDAIAASNKKAGKSSKRKTFALTPEQQLLADNFTANKGKLPWPVEKGIVKLRYGKNRSPIDPSLQIQSNGVRIATNKGEQVRAIWEGVVQGVMTPKNGNNTIMIRHGNYISVYKNLGRFYVNKGDRVNTKQTIGEVITNKASGETILTFGIFKDSSIQNPSDWIYKLY